MLRLVLHEAYGIELNHHNFVDRKPTFTVCFPVLTQNVEQAYLEGVTAVSACSYPCLGNFLQGKVVLNFPRDDKT